SILSIFFFSSRRRHTRCLSDWSSDVCSSDLVGTEPAPCRERAFELELPPIQLAGVLEPFDIFAAIGVNDGQFIAGSFIRRTGFRSEERRVGKECRSRCWRQEQKIKIVENDEG